ncbi:hypothetical protein P3L10_003318 [Capsicum annuum]
MPSNKSDSENESYTEKYKALVDNTNDKSSSLRDYIMLVIIVIIIAMIAIGVIIWKMKGKEMKPILKVVSLQLPTGLEVTNTTMLGNWLLNISITNPNDDYGINFIDQKLVISYENNHLAKDVIGPFRMPKRNSTFVFVNVTTAPETVVNKSILEKAEADRNSDRILIFFVRINMRYEYVYPGYSNQEKMRLYCYDLKVQFGNDPKDKAELIEPEKINYAGTVL